MLVVLFLDHLSCILENYRTIFLFVVGVKEYIVSNFDQKAHEYEALLRSLCNWFYSSDCHLFHLVLEWILTCDLRRCFF